jgi:hypothetical protein
MNARKTSKRIVTFIIVLCASGYKKGAAVGKCGLIPNATTYAELRIPVLPNPVPEAVQHWLSTEQTVMTKAWE